MLGNLNKNFIEWRLLWSADHLANLKILRVSKRADISSGTLSWPRLRNSLTKLMDTFIPAVGDELENEKDGQASLRP